MWHSCHRHPYSSLWRIIACRLYVVLVLFLIGHDNGEGLPLAFSTTHGAKKFLSLSPRIPVDFSFHFRSSDNIFLHHYCCKSNRFWYECLCRYEEYKTEFITTQKRTFFEQHKDEDWYGHKDSYLFHWPVLQMYGGLLDVSWFISNSFSKRLLMDEMFFPGCGRSTTQHDWRLY